MKPGGGRAKGHAFERWVSGELRPVFPEAKRGLSQTRNGKECSDVEGTPFHVECKRGRKTNIKAAIQQAMRDTDGRPVVAVTKDDHAEPLATMRLEDWLVMVRELEAYRTERRGLCITRSA